MTNPKVLILGKGESGKDHFTSLLCELTDLTFTSSSWFLANIIFEKFGGYAVYPDVQSCFDDRRNRRTEWFNFVRGYNLVEPDRLAREILEVSDVYVGLRSIEEFKAARHLFDFIFYIDASKRVKKVDETFEIPFDSGMIRINNNSDLENLKHQAKIAAELITGRAFLCK